VDPPRKGLDQEVIDVLLDTSPTYSGPIRLVYVSCGFKALERDLQVLGTKWKILHAEGFVLFPGSNHIETLVVMDRKK
jgi:tRNA/tmRNA/rRNA uracil-C5-methylase (TrmA/RlmC/RlmD family)